MEGIPSCFCSVNAQRTKLTLMDSAEIVLQNDTIFNGCDVVMSNDVISPAIVDPPSWILLFS